jgi:hypothetical protein
MNIQVMMQVAGPHIDVASVSEVAKAIIFGQSSALLLAGCGFIRISSAGTDHKKQWGTLWMEVN